MSSSRGATVPTVQADALPDSTPNSLPDAPSDSPHAVALTACTGYERAQVEAAVCTVLDASGWATHIGPGRTVLVKPNLLRAQGLACTHPEVVRAACVWLHDHGVRVVVGDSPGFGSLAGVAGHLGLDACLKPLGVPLVAFDAPVPVRLPDGRTWGVARQALECDAILSIPKVKAHAQMRLTLAVKNLFGCVCGLRKAVAHTVQGQDLHMFAACVAALWAALPPSAGLADGITAMQGTGPSGGEALALGCVGAAGCSVALDTGLYTLLGAQPEAIPLWHALRVREAAVAQAFSDHLTYPLHTPEALRVPFRMPEHLTDISFRPHRLLWSLARRVWLGWKS